MSRDLPPGVKLTLDDAYILAHSLGAGMVAGMVRREEKLKLKVCSSYVGPGTLWHWGVVSVRPNSLSLWFLFFWQYWK